VRLLYSLDPFKHIVAISTDPQSSGEGDSIGYAGRQRGRAIHLAILQHVQATVKQSR